MIHLLTLKANFGKPRLIIHPALIQDLDNDTLILFDCGYTGFLPQIEQDMNKINLSLADVTHLIISHHDHDHMGALAEIIDQHPNIEVMTSPEQFPFVTGQTESMRLTQVKTRHPFLPEEKQQGNLELINHIEAMRPIPHATIVNHGQILSYHGGIEIIDTSGHMPGHISLYLPTEKTLIAGDALIMENGKLGLPYPRYSFDHPTAINSARQLLNYDIQKVICYHGGTTTINIKHQLNALLADHQ